MTRTSTTLRFALLLTAANAFLDAHTYIARGHVFANVQTGNVIFFAMDASEGHLVTALAHVWPILAFMAGVLLAGSTGISSIRCAGRCWRRPSCWP